MGNGRSWNQKGKTQNFRKLLQIWTETHNEKWEISSTVLDESSKKSNKNRCSKSSKITENAKVVKKYWWKISKLILTLSKEEFDFKIWIKNIFLPALLFHVWIDLRKHLKNEPKAKIEKNTKRASFFSFFFFNISAKKKHKLRKLKFKSHKMWPHI